MASWVWVWGVRGFFVNIESSNQLLWSKMEEKHRVNMAVCM